MKPTRSHGLSRAPHLLAAALLALVPGAAQTASAQTCGSPIVAGIGSTPFATQPGAPLLNLAGLCDVSQTSADRIHNPAWFEFTAPSSGTFVADTCGSINFDSKIAVFTSCGQLNSVIACNDDASGCLNSQGQPFASRVAFQGVAGTTYFIAVGGYATSTNGSGSLQVNADAPPPGGCASATVAAIGPNAFNTSSSSESVDLSGRCDPGASGDDVMRRVAWFRWTATTTGRAEVSTCGTAGFDTRLAVFASCDQASVIACGDDTPGCVGFTSRLAFDVTAGTDYLIAVGGFDAASAGSGVLVVSPTATPPTSCGTGSNDCCVASLDGTPHCSNAACCELVCSDDPFCCASDGEWDDVCAERAAVLCTSCGAGNCTLPTATATETESCGQDVNAGCSTQSAGPTQPIAPGTSLAGKVWALGGTRDTDWYSFDVPATSTATVTLHSNGPCQAFIVDASCPGYSVLGQTNPNSVACPVSISRCLVPGSYRIVVLMSVFDGFPCTASGERNAYVVSLSLGACDATVPENDDCANAAPVPAAGASVAFDTRLASNSATVLGPACDEGNGTAIVRDVWYSWRPAAGPVRVSTCGSADFDTRLGAYVSCGTEVVAIACNDDAAGCDGFTSKMQFTADGSTTYLIRLGGFEGTGTGSVRFLRVAVPTNDECSAATPIGDGTHAFATEDASTSAPALPPSCDEGFGLDLERDVWFRYVPTCSGTAVATTCGSADFDTRLAVYAACGDAVPLACNDDWKGCSELTSRVEFAAVAGTPYLIRVGGNGAAGLGSLTVSCSGGVPGNDTCAGATVATVGPNAFNNVLAASDAPLGALGGCVGPDSSNDVWFRYVPAASGVATFDTCAAAAFDTRIELWLGCPEKGGSPLACNDEGCGQRSTVSRFVECGRQYFVRIASPDPNGRGTGILTIAQQGSGCPQPCSGDLDGDGAVNGLDLGRLLGRWGLDGVSDLNGDGSTDGLDLGVMLGDWGTCPSVTP